MTSTDAVDGTRFPRWLTRFGSPRASLVAILLVGLTSGIGALLDTWRGAAAAHWHVFDTTWFSIMLGGCGLHALAAALTRIPWRRRDLGPVVIYSSVALLIAGHLYSHFLGVSGEIVLREGESADHFVRPDRTRLTATRQGRPDEAPYEFAFDGGPDNWPAGRTLDLGEVDGVSARVLHYYAHAWPVVEWLDATAETGGPSVRLNVTGPKGERVSEPQLIDDGLGEELFVGPLRMQLYRSTGAGMLADFLQPPSRTEESLGPHGLLMAFHGDSATPIPVRENLGRRVPVGGGGLQVELVAYLPHARPDRLGKFTSAGDEPKNPVVELRIHEPQAGQQTGDAPEPLRQLAFAKSPLLNLDPVNGRPCPVKFRYYHPRIEPAPGLELIQDAAGRLHGRVASGGQYRVLGAVSRGSTLEVANGFAVQLAEHRPFVRQHVSWRPAEPAELASSWQTSSATRDVPRPAIEVEIRTAGVTHTAWLQRDQPGLNRSVVAAPQGPLEVTCEADQVPLGYTIELAGVEHAHSSASRASALASQLKTVDADGRSRPPRTIAPNQPFSYGSYRLHQLEVQDVGHGKRTARLLVASAPGRPFQYLGGLLVILGTVMTLAGLARANAAAVRPMEVDPSTAESDAPETRAQVNAAPETDMSETASPETDATESSRPRRSRWSSAAAVLACVALGASSGAWNGSSVARAEKPASPASFAPGRFDWQAWRQWPVFEGGRAKPLDTFAREFLHGNLSRSAAHDSSTRETLEPVAFTMALVFEWTGWDHPSIERLLLVKDTRSEYLQFHQPDRWDHLPLFRVDDPALRSALGLEDQDRYVAPAMLSKLRVEDPDGQDSRALPFSAWALVASERARSGMPVTSLERTGLELAERLWAYQDLRMGRHFAALPDGTGEWRSLDWLALTPFDASTDPSGERRNAQRAFWAARRAYRDGDLAKFTESSRGLLWAVRKDADRVPGYPPRQRVVCEIAVQRWRPARMAWMLLASAGVALLVRGLVKKSERTPDLTHGVARTRPALMRACDVWAWASYLGGAAAAVMAVALRMWVSGHAPVTSSYETFMLAGAAASCLGVVFTWRQRSADVLGVAAVVAVLAIAPVELGVGSFDATIRPLDPELRSSVWLTAQVALMAIGYAAWAVACGLAIFDLFRSAWTRYLGVMVERSREGESTAKFGRTIEHAISLGVGLSVAGLVSGAIWSDMAWGQFWDWNLREVAALVGVLPYVAILIARRHAWLGDHARSWATSLAFLVLAISLK